MTIVGLLIALVIVCVVFWAINAIMAATGIGEPIVTIMRVLFVILVLLWLLNALGVVNLGPSLRLR